MRITSFTPLILASALIFTTSARAQDPHAQEPDAPAPTNIDPTHASKAELTAEAWSLLTNAATDKHSDTRIQALAALGTMSDPKSTDMIAKAMGDPDVDTRTAAVLAAGQSKTLVLRGKLHNLLNDKEPQVAFAAATTLWKLKDYTGEDILMAVAAGDRKANASMLNGAEHTVSHDFHNPASLAKMGALEGASFLLGPFGFGITAIEYMRKNGGSSARVTAIEELAEERTAPVRAALLDALNDKDPGVRAAAAKALGSYREPDVANALSKVMIDPKAPVRYTASAAYLRSIGVSATPAKTTISR